MKQRIVFTGGGTGGHVYPGLAVAAEIRRRWDGPMTWMGSTRGIEATIVLGSGIDNLEFCPIPAGKLRRYLSIQNLFDLFRIAGGFFSCLWKFLLNRPAVVFSKGGYVTVPPVWAAGVLKIPVVSHESDLDPGLATRLNMNRSTKIFLAYQESCSFFPKSVEDRLMVSGNPIRQSLFTGSKDEALRIFPGLNGDLPIIAVLGGSLGAVQVNDLIKGSLSLLKGKAVVIHQYGSNWQAPVERPGWYYPKEFLSTAMKHVLAAADIAVARAGAGTLWEIGAIGIPGILIPLTAGSRGDQVRNAEVFSRTGAYITLIDPSQEEFNNELVSLVEDGQKRRTMAGKAQQLPRDAACRIADYLESFVK